MNVEKEIAEIDQKVRRQINASAREALLRIGVDPDEVEREEAARRREELLAPYVAAGAALRMICDVVAETINAAVAAFERGFNGGGR